VSVLLKKPLFEGVSNRELAQQLEARKKCEKKLPTWFGRPNIYYPHKLKIEQTSSEITARYKSRIVSGKTLADTTGGFGVDSYFFGQKMEQIVHCEIDENLSQIAAHNFEVLGTGNIKTIPTDGMEFLRDSDMRFGWIYLDPSRRSYSKGKVFRLSECRPNILDNLELLFAKSDNVLLKTSPLLDFSIGIAELRFVKDIHVIAIKNEVKELLWVLRKGYSGEITVKTINFSTARASPVHLAKTRAETFDFSLSEEKEAVAQYAPPLSYLYEPNAAVLKSGAFKTIGNRFGLKKLHEHTHLYTSAELIDFPGRRFEVKKCMAFNKKAIQNLSVSQANITTRNFPQSVAQLRGKFKIGEGGIIYLFFATDLNGDYIVLNCSKLKNC
jgi:hypothetical protein